MLELLECDVKAPDAAALLNELNAALTRLTGRSGAAGFDAADVLDGRGIFLVAYLDGHPIACGAYRHISADTAEVKRVYARSNTVGAAAKLLAELERRAVCAGYTRLVLETRRVNRHAVKFYLQNRYTICENYGRYAGRTEAVCFEKGLVEKG